MKKRQWVKVFALLFAVCIFATGCGNHTAKTRDGRKILELTVWNTQGTEYLPPTEPTENVVEDWLVEKTAVKVKNIYGNDGGQWDPKLTKLVAGDNLPDLVVCGAGQGAAHFSKLNELKKVWQLTPEILKEYAPEVWKQIPQDQWDKLTVDGKILGIPFDYSAYAIDGGIGNFNLSDEDKAYISQNLLNKTNEFMFDPTRAFWVRDDILKMIYPEAKTYDELVALLEERNEPIGEELLDIPIYSEQDYIDFMYKIKELNLKENGKTVYAFGYQGGDNWTALSYLGADMCGYKGNNYTSTWNSKTQRIEIPLVHDVIKHAASIQNKMIRDGVIEPESLAQTVDMYKQKGITGQYALIDIAYVSSTINEDLKKMGASYRYRPFITQVPAIEGYEVKNDITSKNSWTQSLCILNTLSEKEMHQVLGWINTQFTDEFLDVYAWGPKEAGLYTENEDGTRTFVDERFTKYFVEGEATALEAVDRKGLGEQKLVVKPTQYSRWTPKIMARYTNYLPAISSGFKFKYDSECVQSIKDAPPFFIWSPEFANLQEVVDFWAERGQWEDKVKVAFAANSDEMFEQKWQEAMDFVNTIVDVKTMEDKMTDIAKEFLK